MPFDIHGDLLARVRASAGQPLRISVVLESDPCAPPFDRTRPRVAAAMLDAQDAAIWCFEAQARRPWLSYQTRFVGLTEQGGAIALMWWSEGNVEDVISALSRGTPHPPIDRALVSRRRAWCSERWPSAVYESAVWIDAIDDELVWWGARHEKGDCEFEIRQSIPAFLESPWIASDAPADLRARLVRAIAEHRVPGADRDPSLAARRGAMARVILLLEEGAAIEHRDAAGRTPLAAAFASQHEQVALHLLRAGASLDAAIEHAYGTTANVLALALDSALRRRWFAIAAELIARGAPVDEPLPARAWELALLAGAPPAMIASMIARGARLDPTSCVWSSARFLQHAWRNPALAALSPVPLPPRPASAPIAPRTARRPPAAQGAPSAPNASRERARSLASAVASGDLAAIEREIAAVSEQGWDGQFAIHHVSRAPAAHQAAIVARLRAAGAAIDAPDRTGATALAKAVRRGALDAARALIDVGASPRMLDDGHSLLAHAVLADAPAIVELLVRAGARDARALELAREKRRDTCVAILLHAH